MSRENKERAWEQVQIKAFTGWVNEHLSQRNLNVSDIKSDLSDGVRLINFLELLSGKRVQVKYDENPPTRIQKIQNLHIALKFLDKELDVKLHGIGAEDFADQNVKMILGFLWTLYKKYRIAVIKHADKSSEEGLLLWCKQTTEGYRDVNIENYKHSFKDGMAFLALIDKFVESNKDIIDYDNYNKENSLDNLTSAFETAEKSLGIPKLLEPQDLLDGNVDERSLVLYISLYFHAFVAAQQKKLIEDEKNKIAERMRGLEGSLEERAKRGAALEEENTTLIKQIQELKQNLAAERDANKELKDRNTYLDERVEVLQQLLDKETQSKQELQKEVETLREDVTNLRKDFDSEKQKATELSELKFTLEEQVQGLEGKVSLMSVSLETETTQHKKESEEIAARTRAELAGLGALKRNLEEHVEDLYRWQKFLNLDSEGQVDFSGEIRPQIVADISSSNFDEQLQYLVKKLDKENAQLQGMLKQKESEAKARKAQEEKKRERQKKNEN